MVEISREPFGEIEGRLIDRFTLANRHGLRVEVITYGGIIRAIWAPDRDGQLANVTLGFADLAGYLDHNDPYFGCIAGRYANRIARRRLHPRRRDLSAPDERRVKPPPRRGTRVRQARLGRRGDPRGRRRRRASLPRQPGWRGGLSRGRCRPRSATCSTTTTGSASTIAPSPTARRSSISPITPTGTSAGKGPGASKITCCGSPPAATPPSTPR